MEDISQKDPVERSIQNTRDLIRRIYPRGGGTIKDSVGYVTLACQSGDVTFDQLLEIRKSLNEIIKVGGVDVDKNVEVADALSEASKMTFFLSGVVVGAREAAKLVSEKVARTG
ncbi:MAG TPA: hypothetical protein VJI74_00995 [Candidatus Paceibacterota bacterium]